MCAGMASRYAAGREPLHSCQRLAQTTHYRIAVATRSGRGQAMVWSHCPLEGREKWLHKGVKNGCTTGKAEMLLAHQGTRQTSSALTLLVNA